MITQKIRDLLKNVNRKNSDEIDNEVKDLQTDIIMRPIKKDIERYGFVNGRKLA